MNGLLDRINNCHKTGAVHGFRMIWCQRGRRFYRLSKEKKQREKCQLQQFSDGREKIYSLVLFRAPPYFSNLPLHATFLSSRSHLRSPPFSLTPSLLLFFALCFSTPCSPCSSSSFTVSHHFLPASPPLLATSFEGATKSCHQIVIPDFPHSGPAAVKQKKKPLHVTA